MKQYKLVLISNLFENKEIIVNDIEKENNSYEKIIKYKIQFKHKKMKEINVMDMKEYLNLDVQLNSHLNSHLNGHLVRHLNRHLYGQLNRHLFRHLNGHLILF